MASVLKTKSLCAPVFVSYFFFFGGGGVFAFSNSQIVLWGQNLLETSWNNRTE